MQFSGGQWETMCPSTFKTRYHALSKPGTPLNYVGGTLDTMYFNQKFDRIKSELHPNNA